MSEWQPIETIPENDMVLLCFYLGIIRIGKWNGDFFECHLALGNTHVTIGCPGIDLPTHWMPLPDPPNAKDSGNETLDAG